jgi:phosphate transport system substrate-binding protein
VPGSKPNKLLFHLMVFLLLLTLPGLSGCSGSDSSAVMEAPSFTIETYPRVDGSTVTIPLSEAVAARLTGMQPEEVRPYILHNKTHQAYINLIEGRVDLIFVTAPSAEELQMAEEAGITMEVIPVVSEAFVFLVNADNPVNELSHEEIRKIYSGAIKNWLELGGPDMPIVAYQRPVNSGSQTGLLDLVMQDLLPAEPPMEQVIAEMGTLIDAVAAYGNQPDAIGYSYYYFVMDMWGSNKIKLVEVDGVAPTTESISSGEYRYTTAYYAVIRADEPQGSPARQVIEWLLSEQGQELAEAAGYVPVR